MSQHGVSRRAARQCVELRDGTTDHYAAGANGNSNILVMLLAATTIASLFSVASSQQAWAKSLAEKKAERAEGNEARNDVPTGEAVLGVAGDPGTEFSGKCTVGEVENSIGGETPEPTPTT